MEKFSDKIEFGNYILGSENKISEYCESKQRKLFSSEITSDLFLHGLLMIFKSGLLVNFSYDNQNKVLLREISEYFTKEGKYKDSKRKGLLIMGKTGCGKTTILNALCYYLNKYFLLPTKLELIQTYKVVRNFHREKYEYIDSLSRKLYLSLDDLGAENLISDYGITTNVILEYLYSAYDKGVTLYASTNLDPKSLREFYGERGYSRLKEMVYFMPLNGGDRR